jgi:hypothetical protein
MCQLNHQISENFRNRQTSTMLDFQFLQDVQILFARSAVACRIYEFSIAPNTLESIINDATE